MSFPFFSFRVSKVYAYCWQTRSTTPQHRLLERELILSYSVLLWGALCTLRRRLRSFIYRRGSPWCSYSPFAKWLVCTYRARAISLPYLLTPLHSNHSYALKGSRPARYRRRYRGYRRHTARAGPSSGERTVAQAITPAAATTSHHRKPSPPASQTN